MIYDSPLKHSVD